MNDEEIIKKIVDVFYRVYGKLGSGFLKKVYENAMAIEPKKDRLKYQKQYPIRILYDGSIIGNYVADFLVGGEIIVGIKAIRELSKVDEAQLLNYLKATGKKKGLLLNYGDKPKIKRMVF